MELKELIDRKYPPSPWEEGDNIPWNEPGFSHRMLKFHLSQENDAASRRFEIIDRHVAWIHNELLGRKPSRVLDLGCGPGFYSERLARLGHHCTGIDYSPASVDYAISTAQRDGLECLYSCQDIRQADYPGENDFAMLIYGELNVFRKSDAGIILRKVWQSLKIGGRLLLEPHTYQVIKQFGQESASWYSSSGGLFSERPHLVLQENFWDDRPKTASRRYYVLDVETSQVTRFAQSMQAYTNAGYRQLLKAHCFHDIEFLPGLSPSDPHKGLLAITAIK